MKSEVRLSDNGHYKPKTATTAMKPYVADAKTIRTVRLQHTSITSPVVVTIADVISTFQPIFEKIQLISCCIYGPPCLENMTSALEAGTSGRLFVVLLEMICFSRTAFRPDSDQNTKT